MGLAIDCTLNAAIISTPLHFVGTAKMNPDTAIGATTRTTDHARFKPGNKQTSLTTDCLLSDIATGNNTCGEFSTIQTTALEIERCAQLRVKAPISRQYHCLQA